jgi:hypothetical protein
MHFLKYLILKKETQKSNFFYYFIERKIGIC